MNPARSPARLPWAEESYRDLGGATSNGMKLSIVTVNYNGSENTVRLLRSLKNQSVKDFEMIVIDNASEGADFNKLQEEVDGAILMRNDKNLGFSGGNNIGIRKALDPSADGGSDWVLLLNNDTHVEPGFIGSLRAKLGDSGGIVGLPLAEGDHTAYCGELKWLKPTLQHVHNPPYSQYLRKNRTYYAIGGGMAIHKNVFDKIGFLDENYFLYFEDVDFNLRAIKAGIAVNFIEEPKAYHQVSATTKKLGSPLLLRYHYRNSLYFNWKNGSGYIKILLWPWSFWVMKKQLWKILFMYKQKESMAIMMGIFDFYRNKMGRIE